MPLQDSPYRGTYSRNGRVSGAVQSIWNQVCDIVVISILENETN